MTTTNRAATSPAPIVVGVDGSQASIAALRRAVEIADALDRPVRALIAWTYPAGSSFTHSSAEDWYPEDEARGVLDDAIAAALGADGARRVQGEVHDGDPASVLIRESASAHMLVVGARGLGGFPGLLLGPVGGAVAEHAPCTVMVVR